MSDTHDIATRHYREIRRDPEFRRRLIDDPASGLKEYFGFMPAGDFRIEVIAQEPDTITIMLPALPSDGDLGDEAIDAVSRRVYDLLFANGVGGYLIPDAALTWVLRDMRSAWIAGRAQKGE